MRIAESPIDVGMAANPDRVIIADINKHTHWDIPLDDLPAVLELAVQAGRNRTLGLESPDHTVRIPADCLFDLCAALGFFLGIKARFDDKQVIVPNRFTTPRDIHVTGTIR